MRIRTILLMILLKTSSMVHSQIVMNVHQSNGTILHLPLNEIDSITYAVCNFATISTQQVGMISATYATFGGIITENGGADITQRGVVWSTSQTPTIDNYLGITNDGQGIGDFTSSLTGLTWSTTYYVRAYATNCAGTAYGNELSFTTTAIISNPGAGVTFDGYSYPTIIMGNGQEWMAENLRTTVFSNGDTIPSITDNISWDQTTTSAWTILDTNYENLYGKLYNGYTVVDARNVCPLGWHAPSLQDFQLLTDYLGGESNAGNLMKSEVWTGNPNTNLSGFSALPAGIRAGSFFEIGNCVNFHLTDFANTEMNLKYSMCVSNSTNAYFGDGANIGCSVRCVKD